MWDQVLSIKMCEERWFGKKYNGAPTDFAHNKKRGAKKMAGTNKNVEKAF